MKKTVALICLMLISGLVLAQQTQTAPAPATGQYDQAAKDIEKKIKDQDRVKIEGLKVLHSAGTVRLEGTADVFGSYYTAEKIAKDFRGVKQVDNQIMVRRKRANDQDIQMTIIQKIQPELRPEPFDLISVKVQNGFVTLLGNVVDESLLDKAMHAAMWVPGVISVDNKIQLGSRSANDDRLRIAVYNRIASDFPQYMRSAHPSVIILVDHGRIRLVGSLSNETEKLRILSAIRSFPGVLSVNGDQLLVEK